MLPIVIVYLFSLHASCAAPTTESVHETFVDCLRNNIKTRSGGHGFEGRSYISDEPFIMLDMFNLRNITVDVQNEVAVVQAGATLGEVYYRIWEKSDVHGFPAGECHTVGVGGHFGGGGYGNMMRKYGLSIDHILDAKIVDVKSRILNKESMGEDLFWAIRGGGGAKELVSLLEKELPTLGLKKENCIEMSWIESAVWWDSFPNGAHPEALLGRKLNSAKFLKRKSDYVKTPISKDGLEWIWKKMIELRQTSMAFNPNDGRMNKISANATAFPHRQGNLFKIEYSVNWEEPGISAEKNFTIQIRRLHSYMTPFVSKNPRRAFLNYRDLDIGINHHDNNSSTKKGRFMVLSTSITTSTDW
ncbi:hypothetical protein JHK82_023833 [Glycine max]|nr:hypothetical protein JHK86_023905 [Glycine max]KAG5132645.1 hypothetical protein JHK82_023833 [Glycine max]